MSRIGKRQSAAIIVLHQDCEAVHLTPQEMRIAGECLADDKIRNEPLDLHIIQRPIQLHSSKFYDWDPLIRPSGGQT